MLIKIEMRSLWRSKELLILLMTFFFIGFTSPILIYYLPDIINTLSNNNDFIMNRIHNPIHYLENYDKNLNQIGLFLCCFILSKRLILNRDKRMYYLYNFKRKEMYYIYKIISTLIVLVLCLLLGDISFMYSMWALNIDINISLFNILILFFIQILGIFSFIIFSQLISLYCHSSILGSVFIQICIIFLNILKDTKMTRNLTPLRTVDLAMNIKDTNVNIPENSIFCALILIIMSYILIVIKKD